jgi:hypothetical protein
MDRWTRNERVYRHLLGMGLIAVPIFADADRTRIDHIVVTSELPFALTEGAAGAGVGLPVAGAEIGQCVRSSVGDRDNVVDFPPVLGVPVTVVAPADDDPESIPAPNSTVEPRGSPADIPEG